MRVPSRPVTVRGLRIRHAGEGRGSPSVCQRRASARLGALNECGRWLEDVLSFDGFLESVLTSHRQGATVPRPHARGFAKTRILTVFGHSPTQRHTWTVPSPLRWSPEERTATRYRLAPKPEPTTAQWHLVVMLHPCKRRYREAVKTNFLRLPLAFADRSPRACSGYLLTRFRPQEPPSTSP
ncbi:hypothetical protein SVAN01_02203 [Stagonosporopsis vannaccii]|nr:hypothetical protein SVAN01_02203 [Stagonosporopsis vannaccii]